MGRLRRYFFTGIITLFPIVVTAYVLTGLFQFADGVLGQFMGQHTPGLGLVLTLVLVFVVGFIANQLIGQWVLRNLERWFGQLPVIRHIYQPVKQLTQFLFSRKDRQSAFRQVVLVSYPRAGSYSVAFVTNESAAGFGGLPGPTLTLLVPTPPSPFTGPIIFVKKDEVMPLEISVEAAIKLIVSGGIISPDKVDAERRRAPRTP